MKRILTFLFAITLVCSVQAQVISFADTNLKKALVKHHPQIDLNDDGQIQMSEAAVVKELDLEGTGVTDLQDLKHFKVLKKLDVNENHLKELNISFLSNLTYLNCESNLLKHLDLNQNLLLDTVLCGGSFIGQIDIGNCSKLKVLSVHANHVESLDLRNKTELVQLRCGSNPIKSLDLSQCSKLKYLDCSNNAYLQNLSLLANADLTYLDCVYNKLTSLDISHNLKLEYLKCSVNELTTLDVSLHGQLKALDCHSNLLTHLQINGKLETLRAQDNKLQAVMIPWFSDLIVLGLARNELKSMYLSDCSELLELDVDQNLLTELDLRDNLKLRGLSCVKNPQLDKVCIDPSHVDIKDRFWKSKNPNVTTWSTTCGVITEAETGLIDKGTAKVLAKVFTLQGQEIPQASAIQGVFLYQYSDNSVDKVIK